MTTTSNTIAAELEAAQLERAKQLMKSDLMAENMRLRITLGQLRKLHVPYVTGTDITDERWVECACCYGGEWPCQTAKLIYTTDELDKLEI